MILSASHVPTALIHPEFASRYFFLLSSRTPKDQVNPIFHGVGFTPDAIVVGAQGYSDYQSRYPGRQLSMDLVDGGYLIGEWRGKTYVLETDPAGQCLLYFWQSGEQWAVSNSFYVLAREIEQLGHRPELYAPALAVFSLGPTGRDHGQLISPRTCIKGAELLPPEARLRITWEDGEGDQAARAKVQLDHRCPPLVKETGNQRYLHLLLSLIETWRDRFVTVREAGWPCRLDLSGGKDSRAVLALMHSVMGREVPAQTYDAASEDGRIAAQLMETHARHIPLWGGFEQRASCSETFALNIMSAAGTRRFNHNDVFLTPTDFFKLSGGASLDVEAFRSPFTRRILNTQNTNLLQNETVREHALQEYHHGAEVSPVSLEDRNAILFHYARYRSRFHYGMSDFISGAHSIMPLFSTAVIALCASALETRYVKLNGLNRDIISVCAPELLSYPFTGDEKGPLLVSRGVSLQDLREPRVLEHFGTPDVTYRSEFGPRTYGPCGEDVLKCLLEPAVRRFGDCFDPRALEWARDDLTAKKPLRSAVHACFLTGLAVLFEPDLLHQVQGPQQQPDPLP